MLGVVMVKRLEMFLELKRRVNLVEISCYSSMRLQAS